MKRRIFRDTLWLCLQAAFAAGMTGCADESCPVCSGGQETDEQGSGVFLSVMIRTDDVPASRSGNSPKPGEAGDGQQAGTEAENRIHTLTLFFFTDESGKGINAEASIPLTTVSFSPNEIVEGSGAYACSVSKEVEGLSVGNSYSVLAIANFSPSGATTLEALRNLQVEAPTTTTAENGQLFTMSSTGPDADRLTIAAGNSKTNPATVTIGMERVAARVDYRVSYPDEKDAFEIPSQTPGAKAEEMDQVKILGAALVNKYAGKSYLFKRVTQGTNLTQPTIVYLGNETVSDGKATNYVLDPQTLTGKAAKDFTAYYPELTGSKWKDDALTFKEPSTETTSTGEGKQFGLLDYTAENVNTLTDAERLPECATGVVFKAEHIPYGKTKGRTCYYTYWIRHADDGEADKVSPMEYATVRNNLYQLDVKSVSGPGTDKPEYEQHIDIRVTVNRWVKARNGQNIEW